MLLLALGLCRAPSALDNDLPAPPPAESEEAKDPHYDPVSWEAPRPAPLGGGATAAPGGKGKGKKKEKDRRRSTGGARAP